MSLAALHRTGSAHEIVAARLRAAGLRVPAPAKPAPVGPPPASKALPMPERSRSSLSLPSAPAPVGASGKVAGGTAAPTPGGLDAAIDRQVAAVKNDPEIQAAFANWASLSTQERIEVAKKIAALQGKTFGFDASLDISHDPSLDAEGKLGLAAGDRITLSTAALADPAQLLDTITHEETHIYDRQTGGGLAADNHNSGVVDDAVYRAGNAVRDGVFGYAA